MVNGWGSISRTRGGSSLTKFRMVDGWTFSYLENSRRRNFGIFIWSDGLGIQAVFIFNEAGHFGQSCGGVLCLWAAEYRAVGSMSSRSALCMSLKPVDGMEDVSSKVFLVRKDILIRTYIRGSFGIPLPGVGVWIVKCLDRRRTRNLSNAVLIFM